MLLELERLHNHIADIGALCNDVGFGIVHAHTQRIRETAAAPQRSTPPATGCCAAASSPAAPPAPRCPTPPRSSPGRRRRRTSIVDIALGQQRRSATASPAPPSSPASRPPSIGTLGYVARACGLAIDARTAHPFIDLGDRPRRPRARDRRRRPGPLPRTRPENSPRPASAILADSSSRCHGSQAPPSRPTRPAAWPLSGIGIVEGWRGTIAHRVEIGHRTARSPASKIVDPSFFNWPALPVALADTIVPDFPLANKSFNLSYAGNDL